MFPIRWFLQAVLARRRRQISRALADPAATQARLLMAMVRRAAATQWGRAHHYKAIRTVADFQKAVPITDYTGQAPWWHRAYHGERDVTWPGHIPYFALTSGTTLGRNKAMPVSRQAIRANVRSGISLLEVIHRQVPDADLSAGRILYFGGSTDLRTNGRCLEGDASGINARHVPWLGQRYRLPDFDIAAMADWEQKVAAICQRHLQAPVRVVVGMPSWTLILFRHLIDAGRQRFGSHIHTVADIWPDLKAFVHFGMAFGPYRKQFQALLGRSVPCIDTYSSSEGGMNAIQDDLTCPAMRMELDGGTFFEFVPIEEYGKPDAPRLTLEQVEPGRAYAVILSTVSGIWAYDLGDVVRFESTSPPRILFAHRTALQLNVFGEHVIQEQLERAIDHACDLADVAVTDYTVAPLMPTTEDPRGGHGWLIEFSGPAPPLERFAASLDQKLCECSEDYAIHRSGDFGMAPPRVIALESGTFYEWMRSTGRLGGQNKVPRICRSPEMRQQLQSLSDRRIPPTVE